MIISRDPTTDFIPYYIEARKLKPALWRQHLFLSNAIPLWLFERIGAFNQKFMENPLSNEEMMMFQKTLFNHGYWTHLHKCCTDKRGEKSRSFKPRNAKCCANKWLRSEITLAEHEDIAFIITLGRDVEKWFREFYEGASLSKTIRIYHLPHPSRTNMASWFPKDERKSKDLESKVRSLVAQCLIKKIDISH